LVRNDDGLLPIGPSAGSRILSLEPVPTNVTPADTTALYPPLLATALRGHHDSVTEIVYPNEPAGNDISAAVESASNHDLVVVGTVAAGSSQAALVEALLATGKPVVTVALRTPYDLTVYPEAGTHLCTYSGHLPSLQALADLVFTGNGGGGTLPASIPGLYPIGHGLKL
jgi:beta-N-acetylhexosaminidase